ncbi:MAG: ATP-binding protein [Bacteroidota bacterium]|nr:ATP-binding protein [Bacteroidota bacterium]
MEKIEIRNYKCLGNIAISNLKRVNLFTGRNNTGKSTILEALSLFAVKGNINWIRQLLDSRGEINNYREENISIENNLNILSSFFYNRQIEFGKDNSIRISSESEELFLRFVKFIEEEVVEKDKTGSEILIGKRKIMSDDLSYDNTSFGFEIKSNEGSRIHNLDKHLFRRSYSVSDSINFHLINSKGDDVINSAKLWDTITFSEKEELVIKALRIIEPNISRLSFVGEDNFRNSRYPIVKLSNTKNVYPLNAMGDGINRILNLTLALVNSDGGFLLIDECENGLHFSVQEKLWEIIFEIASKLDIQIFATTHSNDSIYSFAKVLENNNKYEGSLYRLERKKEIVIANPFSKDEITEAAKQGINLR